MDDNKFELNIEIALNYVFMVSRSVFICFVQKCSLYNYEINFIHNYEVCYNSVILIFNTR